MLVDNNIVFTQDMPKIYFLFNVCVRAITVLRSWMLIAMEHMRDGRFLS